MGDLEAVISGSLADARDEGTLVDTPDPGDSTAGDVGDTTGTTTTEGTATAAAGATTETAVPPPSAEDVALATELGITLPKPGERENKIPYSRVKTIVGNAQKKVATEVADVLGVQLTDDLLKPGALKAALGERLGEVPALKQRISEMETVEPIMLNEPRRFMEMLVKINPAYGEFLDGSGRGTSGDKTGAVPDGMPVGDVDLGNGMKTYSPEKLVELVQWAAAQGEKKRDERFKPILDRIEQEQRIAEAMPRLQAVLDDAATWEGFTDHQAEILAELQRDSEAAAKTGGKPKLTLESAYRKVVLPKLKEKYTTDHNKVRDAVLKEMQATPNSTTAPVSTTAGAATVGDGQRPLEDVIKASIAGLK